MNLFNFHTHHPVRDGEYTISICGLHPWHVTPDWQRILNLYLGPLPFPGSYEPKLLQAIGECGLDRACEVPYELQLQAFKAQIAESEMRHLPLVIHCVHAIDDILPLRRQATQPWVWHGFRGKPQQLKSLIDYGFYVSFGLRYNPESLKQCPADRLFLETDESDVSIAPLYEEAAALRQTTVEALARQIDDNANFIFF